MRASCRRSEKRLLVAMALVRFLSLAQAREQRGNVVDLQSSRSGAQEVEDICDTLLRNPW